MKKVSILLLLAGAFLCLCCKHSLLGEETARQLVKETLQDSTRCNMVADTLIKDKKMAVDIAELYAFRAFGKEKVKDERPYETYLVDGYWVVMGTLSEYALSGGTFEVIIDARNGKVIRLMHGK